MKGHNDPGLPAHRAPAVCDRHGRLKHVTYLVTDAELLGDSVPAGGRGRLAMDCAARDNLSVLSSTRRLRGRVIAYGSSLLPPCHSVLEVTSHNEGHSASYNHHARGPQVASALACLIKVQLCGFADESR